MPLYLSIAEELPYLTGNHGMDDKKLAYHMGSHPGLTLCASMQAGPNREKLTVVNVQRTVQKAVWEEDT